MLKTLSVTTTPPMRSAIPIPMIVTMGTEALRSACRMRTVRLSTPFARAVRM